MPPSAAWTPRKMLPPANDDRTFYSSLHQGFYFLRITRKLLIVNAKLLRAHQGFTTKLQ